MYVGVTSGSGNMNIPRPDELPPRNQHYAPGYRPTNAGGVGALAGAGAGLVVGAVTTCGVGLAVFGVVGSTTAVIKALRDDASNRHERIDESLNQLRKNIDQAKNDEALCQSISLIDSESKLFARAGRTHDRLELILQAQAKRWQLALRRGKFNQSSPVPSTLPPAAERLLRSVDAWNKAFFTHRPNFSP